MIRTASLAFASFLCLVLSSCLSGCAQNTKTPTINDQRQPQAQALDQAQQGVNVRNTWNIITYPAGVSSGEPSLVSSDGDIQADLSGASASPSAAGLARAKAGFQTQNGLSWYVVTTGSGTGTQTPTLTGGTLTSSQTPTVTTTQEPKNVIEIPFSIAPWGIASASGQAQLSDGGATGGTMTLTPQQDATLQQLKANVAGASGPQALEALGALNKWWGDLLVSKGFPRPPTPTTQPVQP